MFYRTAQSLYHSLTFIYTMAPHLLPPASFSIAMDENDVKQNQIWFDFQFLNQFFSLLIEMKEIKIVIEWALWFVIWYLVQFHLIFSSFYSLASEFGVSIQFLYNFNGIHKSSIGAPHCWWHDSILCHFILPLASSYSRSVALSFRQFHFLILKMFVRLSEDFSGRIDTFPIGNWWKATT